MILQFTEPQQIENLYPLTLTRPAADLRCGMLTVAEKWMHDLGVPANNTGFITREYLQHPDGRFNNIHETHQNTIALQINGGAIPNPGLIEKVKQLQPGQLLSKEGKHIAACISHPSQQNVLSAPEQYQIIECECHIDWIDRPYHIFALNGKEIVQDFARITAGRASATLSDSNRTIGDFPIFLEEGAKVECCTLNSKEGPIYIGKNAEIMEGSLVRGPLALCEGAVLKMGSKVYSGTTLGPYSVAGGEISNVVFWGYSNKGHDGFLGNAVLGEWCNIGADTNASNLKNTYDEVKVWNYASGRFDRSGQQFCGLIMGDHSKCGINTMFNTGTVVGVACNLFGAGFPRQFVPDFSWGGAQGFVTHKLDAVHKTANLVMPRRKRTYGDFEKSVMEAVFAITEPLRGEG
jgi:UDP-N-acetylglucosamine diphosphorylase/glucosamine-1-phosphate N-acetyltransferase